MAYREMTKGERRQNKRDKKRHGMRVRGKSTVTFNVERQAREQRKKALQKARQQKQNSQ